MGRDCPTCGAEMKNNSISGDYVVRGRVQGVDISQFHCPECGTIVDDFENVITKRDQQHDMAWKLYAMRLDDWSVIPRA